jgi:hypothetical protein
LLYRHDEPRIEVVAQGQPWSFDGDSHQFRLVSEAHRIRLAHLFDPVLAVHTSIVEPLPHQITAVYESMLPRQPLRFLLADDPGAGKTIMAGLFIKELIARGDLQRCLVVCPGSLAEQWQDELYRRFHLPFEILTNDKLEAARTGNWFVENNLIIARLDKLSRNEDVQAKLSVPDARWDLVVCDEAHKMSATYFGGEVKYTKRYKLGQLLSTVTRHFLLMTATPHNGKDEDFQLFMALLDGDRFEGKFRDGVHTADVSDMMRRMVKENLLKFDATPLFPEGIANTVPYKLSDGEAQLYKAGHRWGKTSGKIGFHGGKVSLARPRVRSRDGQEMALPSWEAAEAEDLLGRWAMNLMLINVSTRRFGRAVRLPEGDIPAAKGAGVSKSAVSRRFVALSAAQMKEWMAADLSKLDLLVIQIDGIHIENDLVLLAAVGPRVKTSCPFPGPEGVTRLIMCR